ncbi:MarR family winged helix-turn-helix transcriptional regulator [Microbacterium sp. ASV49]|uniref:MarR family winged helix-turn-helix transcriptional regulator n=1 Tax=Microbacterium candidum TaxID=3041922 RepID=A0ABT7MTJ0_9MICO|nr:MarR family winged helix-turn-helix transcriptional regulator [Microbacterium sp. ASV49]MDL9977761.1 MarR family winged helix-turn-helix transcriptional regulator [Microbacterium sp. ASV49]
MSEADRDTDIDRIASALARLRGRRMPFPGAPGDVPPWPRPGMPGMPGMRGGFGPHGGAHHGHGDGEHSPNGWPHQPPPWAGMHGRFGGPARFRLLEALAKASGPLSVSALGDAIGVDQPRASRLVQQAVEMGLVRREADPDDARRTRIALTTDGERLVRGFLGQRTDAVASAITGFTDAERAELARLLTKLADAWPGQIPGR